MQRTITFLWGAVLLAVSILTAPIPARASVFLCHGDSITYGDSGSSSDSYLGPLAIYLSSIGDPSAMINSGVGGETTTGGLDRLRSTVRSTSADTVILMEGTNDLYAWVLRPAELDPDGTRANLREMVRVARDAGKRVILATVAPRVSDGLDPDNYWTERLNTIIRDIAIERGTPLAEVYNHLAPVASRLFYKDSLHPAGIGCQLMAEAIGAAVTGNAIGTIDLSGPVPVDASPWPNAAGVSRTAAVEITVRELVSTVDTATAQMTVDGAVVTPQVTSLSNNQVRFRYVPPQPFAFAQSVRVTLTVSDTSLPANQTYLVYSFRTFYGNGTSGDVDGSGRIDGRDVGILAIGFGSRSGEPRYRYEADIDADGVIDGRDLAIVASGFGGSP